MSPPPCAETFSLGATPTTREAQAIADEVFADFVSAEVDKVELVYTKFVSLINSTPTIQVGSWGGAAAWVGGRGRAGGGGSFVVSIKRVTHQVNTTNHPCAWEMQPLGLQEGGRW